MRRPMLLAALTALAVRALVVAKLPAAAVWDGALYARLAQHLARGEGFVHWAAAAPPFRATAFYPVGYPALIALVVAVSHAGAAMAAQAINLVASAVAAACAASLGYRVALSRGGYFAGLAYALAPGPALWTAATMTETVTGALLVAAVSASVVPVAATRARIGWASLAGALVGLGALVRPQVILAAPFLGGLPPAPRTTRMLATVACVLAALAVVLPWTARNCEALGACALVSTNGGSNLLIGTFADASGGYREPTPADGCSTVRGEPARDRCMTRLAVHRIAHDPIAWARLDAAKLFKTFAYEWAPVSYIHSAIPAAFDGGSAERAAAICSLWWWALVVCAIVGGRRAARAGGRLQALVRVVALNVVLFAATHAIFIGDDRYHLPLVPLLAALAAGVLLPPRPGPEPEMVWAQ